MIWYFVFCISVVLSLNPCKIDSTACVPIEDFETNCTCILISGKPINASEDVFLYFMGYEFPLNLFSQVPISKLFRDKLNSRLPKKTDYESSLDLPQTIFRNLQTDENMALFIVNSTRSTEIIARLINESFIQTDDLRNNSDKWCSEGECSAFVHSTITLNRTIGIYSHAADILEVLEYRGRSMFAVSSVKSQFDIPKVHNLHCEQKCRRFYFNENILCRQKCVQGLRFDQVAITGDIKRKFENFVKASAVKNLREKYYKYFRRQYQ
ncbi:unnamed protein product [Auanema sp. JU1783]|nr:unnamed protein product [Auanema sp. JU1783]